MSEGILLSYLNCKFVHMIGRKENFFLFHYSILKEWVHLHGRNSPSWRASAIGKVSGVVSNKRLKKSSNLPRGKAGNPCLTASQPASQLVR